jgi:hydroxypyruvate isomerase
MGGILSVRFAGGAAFPCTVRARARTGGVAQEPPGPAVNLREHKTWGETMNKNNAAAPPRRYFLAGAAALPLALAAVEKGAARAAAAALSAQDAPAPKYTLSVNLELMFPREMPVLERLQRVADEGAKAYSFWAFGGKDLDKMRAIQDRHKMTCASITGANKTGWNTGLTKTGYEKEFLADFSEAVAVAKKMGVPNLITFVGEIQKNIAPEVQHAQIVSGLKKAGDIAGAAGVFLTLEPLNAVESPQMSVNTTAYAYKIIAEVAHPHVKVDFDLYHRQLGEGNLINTLKTGLEKGYVTFVEVGDVPGRFEPGTGEVDYARIFRVLREAGYAGYIGMEHRAQIGYKEALARVRRLAGVTV